MSKTLSFLSQSNAKQKLNYYCKRSVQQLPMLLRDMIFNWIIYIYIGIKLLYLLSSGYITLFWILQNRPIFPSCLAKLIFNSFTNRAEHMSLSFITYKWDLVTTHRVENLWADIVVLEISLHRNAHAYFWNIAIEFNKTLLCLYFWFTTKLRRAS